MHNDIIEKTKEFVKSKLEGEGSGHDWWHCYRVFKLSLTLAEKEGGDILVIQLAALLHDIVDWKFAKNQDETIGSQVAYDWVKKQGLTEEIAAHVKDIVLSTSFKGAGTTSPMKTIEGKIVQDADRLDAIGAIGIGRTFAFGGAKDREMYNPNIKPEIHNSFQEYKKSKGTVVNHFYEKLLLLKDRMNTETGKKFAKDRHNFMVLFLNEFLKEWDGLA
ncbi:HD domain-containing protein [bacterium]|jgi:uncharacterized protein|nr:HD domain-containing protein [bacterium]